MTLSSHRSRSALQVLPLEIKNLSDTDFNLLMLDLLRAQAYRCGVPPNGVIINSEEKAKDDGADGTSSAPVTADHWLGNEETCWQLKAGTAGQPAKLIKEITKKIPKETLLKGGRFVLVTNGSNNGAKGESDRLKILTEVATSNSLPTSKIHVIGTERLTEWCNLHPAIAGKYGGRPTGLWTLSDWVASEDHQVPWQSSEALDAKILEHQNDLDFNTGSVLHLHVQGLPGVGKSRFALELCKNAAWSSTVIYFRQASDTRLNELIDSVSRDSDVQLMVVADEVQHSHLSPLRDSIGRSSGRIKLITIGHSHSPDPRKIVSTHIAPLSDTQMSAIIRGWHQSMPIEHVEFTSRFAGGFVKLAHLVSDSVAANPSLDVRGLLDLDHIRGFLDQMLGDGNRRSLFVVAALNRVGWSGDLQIEGETIAKHLGLDWDTVRHDIEVFHRKYGIVPQGGRYRYISPSPLGNYLALDAWSLYPEKMKLLPTVLPNDESKDSFNTRLKQVAGSPEAKDFARDELAFFFQLNRFTNIADASRWSALSIADPQLAVNNLFATLENSEVDERDLIKDSARRELIWALVKMSRSQSTFQKATLSLALLAEAENESYANNSTSEFISKFQIRGGDTPVPYLHRLVVLDDLLAKKKEVLNSLVFLALMKWDETQGFRTISSLAIWEPPETDWKPKNPEEYIQCVDAATKRMCDLIDSGISGVEQHIDKVPEKFTRYLQYPQIRELIADLFRTLEKSYPSTKEIIHKSIGMILHSEKRRPSDILKDDLDFIKDLHSEFEDVSLPGRIHQILSQNFWGEDDEDIDYKSLAIEILKDDSILEDELPWLTSGKAGGAWALGLALADADTDNHLQTTLPNFPSKGNDLRLVCGYVNRKRESLGDEWFDIWFTTRAEAVNLDTSLLIEISYRCGVTINSLSRLTEIFDSQAIEPMIAGQLSYGTWSRGLPKKEFHKLLVSMSNQGHQATVAALVEDRLKENEDEKPYWTEFVLTLVTNPELVRGQSMTEHYWSQLALKYVDTESKAIARSIFEQQATRRTDSWFIKYSTASKVLTHCFEIDPIGSWDVLTYFLTDSEIGWSFRIGFPRGLVDKVPWDSIHTWISEDALTRANLLSYYVEKNVSDDFTYASRIIGEYGDDETVAGAYMSAFSTGSWTGSSARRFEQIANSLYEVAKSTELINLRNWANRAGDIFTEQAVRDQQSEDEDELRWG